MSNGILYLNTGKKCIPRLLVSIHSLKKVYKGEIRIVSFGDESNIWCKKIAEYFGTQIEENPESDLSTIKNFSWFEKIRLVDHTPFDNNLYIDADTLIKKDPSDIFVELEKQELIPFQFANWTTKTKKVSGRLNTLHGISRERIDSAISSNFCSVNGGVIAFRKNSELMRKWFDLTLQNKDSYLPDETCLHLLCFENDIKIYSHIYNCSCQYDNPRLDDIRIIHYHGRKHCRRGDDGKPIFNADFWIKEFREVYDKNIIDIRKNYKDFGDKKLKRIEL